MKLDRGLSVFDGSMILDAKKRQPFSLKIGKLDLRDGLSFIIIIRQTYRTWTVIPKPTPNQQMGTCHNEILSNQERASG
jgi:hypothetical protein